MSNKVHAAAVIIITYCTVMFFPQAAFLLPVLTAMQNDGLSGSQFSDVQAPSALVISPTRELTCQIYMEARKFAHKTMLRAVVCYGGVSVSHQLKQIEYGCHMLVATPGRLKDFVQRKKVNKAYYVVATLWRLGYFNYYSV